MTAVLESPRMSDPQSPSILVLASASPRRRELITLTGWTVDVRPASADEEARPGEGAAPLAQRLSRAKAAVILAEANAGSLVLGADTVVALDGALMGKPANADDARRMLEALRARTHEVVTGLTLMADDGKWEAQEVCRTSVPMRDYSPRAIEDYIASGAAFDKAGGYGIQDHGFDPVDMNLLTGCYANVMGLPLCHLARLMRRRGLQPRSDVPAVCQSHTGYRCRVYPEILGTES